MKTTTSKSTRNQAFTTLLGTAIVVLAHAASAHAQGDAGKGDFAVCAACHSTTGSEGVGPHLNGVVGRRSGSVAAFNYSGAMKRANIVWDDKTLDAFITDPQAVVRGNHMPFAGLDDSAKRARIIAYLKSQR
jgi:cytochrome c